LRAPSWKQGHTHHIQPRTSHKTQHTPHGVTREQAQGKVRETPQLVSLTFRGWADTSTDGQSRQAGATSTHAHTQQRTQASWLCSVTRCVWHSHMAAAASRGSMGCLAQSVGYMTNAADAHTTLAPGWHGARSRTPPPPHTHPATRQTTQVEGAKVQRGGQVNEQG
jgi:hypothetical protein